MPGFKIKKQEGYEISIAEKETLEAITVLGDPGADRILFWDESANTWKFLTVGSGLNITDTTITATSSGDVIGPASATDNAIVRFNLTTGKLIQNSNVIIDDNGAMQMPNNQWFSFKDYAGTGSINAFKGTIDDEVDIGAQLNVGTIEADSDAGAVALFDMPVSDASDDGAEMSVAIRIDANDILKVGAKADGAGGVDGLFVKNYGANIQNITVVNASTYTVLERDNIIHSTYSATEAQTITIPTAQLVSGRIIVIKDAGGNASEKNITVGTEGDEKIDGSDTAVINSNYGVITLYSNGSNWFKI